MADARARRLAALGDAMTAAHLDALLVTSLPNVRYLTGFSGSSALVLVTPRETLFITDFRYQTQVADEVGALARVVIEPVSLWNALWHELPGTGGRVVGFETAHVTHRDFQRLLEAGSAWQWRPTADLVEGLRERKDEGEVALIARAAEVATRALARTLPEIGAGMTELQAAGVLERALREEGSEGFAFPTIVAAGARAALPHAQPTHHAVREGDFLLFDFGALVEGYCSDVTRTVVVGRASAEQREVYEVVREANAAARAAVRPGMTGRDADAVARSYIERHGLGELFGHSLGHGIGLEIHEAPRLARTNEQPLAAGAVVTIEPGVYRPGWGGVRIEDDVWLSPDGTGPRLLTDFPRDLLELV
ncbi:MAG: aminopeptidase P family protein [Gemmatimonadota bacterium]|nr:aminopeptidase P family protein [Gemmatimonadota bacterium]MDE3215499.1 aminopeptidase P family protein [Gemmatimonadota bacterium]